MNVALRTPMTLQAFLAWEERQPLRYEFDGFNPIAMTGGTAATPPYSATCCLHSLAVCAAWPASHMAAN